MAFVVVRLVFLFVASKLFPLFFIIACIYNVFRFSDVSRVCFSLCLSWLIKHRKCLNVNFLSVELVPNSQAKDQPISFRVLALFTHSDSISVSEQICFV